MHYAQRKGFTLVELMIVIAIIGILAATLLPTLTGSQARSRDTARKSSMHNIQVALETFYNDRNVYPTNTGLAVGQTDTGLTLGAFTGCVSSSGGTATGYFADLFKGAAVPRDPQLTNAVVTCGTGGVFGYVPLQVNGVNNAGYVIAADVETYQAANTTSGGVLTGTTILNADYGALVGTTFGAAGTATGSLRPAQLINAAADVNGENTVYFQTQNS